MWLPKPTDKCIGGRLSPAATWAEVRMCVSDVTQHGFSLSSVPDLRGFTLRCVLYTVHIEWSCIKLFVLLDTLSYVRTVSIQSGARGSSPVLVSKSVTVLLVIREQKVVLHLNSYFVGINEWLSLGISSCLWGYRDYVTARVSTQTGLGLLTGGRLWMLA